MAAKEIDLNKTSSFKNTPKWSIAARTPQRELAKGMPGPGAYGQTHTEKDKFASTPKFTMASGQRDGKEWSAMPGPGKYAPNPDYKTMPKWGFGSEPRLHDVKRGRTPGPGAYENRGNLDGLKFSVCSRPEGTSKLSKTPGPGNYKVNYDQSSMYASSPSISFGAGARAELVPSKTPGPGAYEKLNILGGNCCMKRPPVFSIAGKRSQPGSDQSPGPGPPATTMAR